MRVKSLKGQAVAVNECAEYLERGGPLTLVLRRAIQRLVAAAAKRDRDERGDECWEHDEEQG